MGKSSRVRHIYTSYAPKEKGYFVISYFYDEWV